MAESEAGNGAPRVALVTGGARGIGRSIALALARQGRFVVIGDVLDQEAEQTVGLVKKAGGQALSVRLDVTQSSTVRAALDEVVEQVGRIDILVNNAGWDELLPFVETDEAFWDRVIEINYKGCLRLTHALLPGMMERRWGRIVSMGSDAGRVGSSFEAVYSGAKAAIVAFMKTIAREGARHGITANSVCPGPTDTPLVRSAIATTQDGEKAVRAMTRAIPLGRLGRPEDVAAGVAFFTSDEAEFVTGQTLSISGGLTMA